MSVNKLIRGGLRVCEVVSGNTTVNVIGTTDGLSPGDRVRGQGIPAGATISSVAATSFVLSAAPTITGNPQLAFEGNMANPGQTGNNTHQSIPVPDTFEVEVLDLELEITAVGATPTISWLYQGAMEGPDVPDSASDWYALSVLPSDTNVEVAAVQTKTGVGSYHSSVEVARRPFRKVRLVTSANTNVTYEADAVAVDSDAI